MIKTLRPHLLFLLFLTCSQAIAQAPQFTQLYNHPTYHNPASAGEMGHARVAVTYRNQWRGVYNGLGTTRMPFQTKFFSFDTYYEASSIGLGVYAFQDNMGPNAENNVLAIQGSYYIPYLFGDDGVSNHLESLEMGMGAAWHSTQYAIGDNSLGGLGFVDQFTGAGNVGPSADPLAATSSLTTNALLFSGGLVYKRFRNRSAANSSGFVISLAAHDLQGKNSPARWDGYITVRIKGTADEECYTFTGHYRHNGMTQQADWLFNSRYLLTSDLPVVGLFGLGVRTIPWRKANDDGTWQRDALLVMGGFDYDALRLSLSCDVPISSLRQRSGNGQRAGLAFEINATYSLPRKFLHKSHSTKTSMRGSQFDKEHTLECEYRKAKGYMAL